MRAEDRRCPKGGTANDSRVEKGVLRRLLQSGAGWQEAFGLPQWEPAGAKIGRFFAFSRTASSFALRHVTVNTPHQETRDIDVLSTRDHPTALI